MGRSSATRRVVHRADKSTAGGRRSTCRLSSPSPPPIAPSHDGAPGASRRWSERIGEVMTTTDHELDDRRAPDPEHPDKPDTPREIEKRSWKYVFVKTAREFTADECSDIAAALTYYAVLAIFPGLVAVFSIFGLIGRSSQATDADHRHRRHGRPRRSRCPARAARAGGGLPRRGLGAASSAWCWRSGRRPATWAPSAAP